MSCFSTVSASVADSNSRGARILQPANVLSPASPMTPFMRLQKVIARKCDRPDVTVVQMVAPTRGAISAVNMIDPGGSERFDRMGGLRRERCCPGCGCHVGDAANLFRWSRETWLSAKASQGEWITSSPVERQLLLQVSANEGNVPNHQFSRRLKRPVSRHFCD